MIVDENPIEELSGIEISPGVLYEFNEHGLTQQVTEIHEKDPILIGSGVLGDFPKNDKDRSHTAILVDFTLKVNK